MQTNVHRGGACAFSFCFWFRTLTHRVWCGLLVPLSLCDSRRCVCRKVYWFSFLWLYVLHLISTLRGDVLPHVRAVFACRGVQIMTTIYSAVSFIYAAHVLSDQRGNGVICCHAALNRNINECDACYANGGFDVVRSAACWFINCDHERAFDVKLFIIFYRSDEY